MCNPEKVYCFEMDDQNISIIGRLLYLNNIEQKVEVVENAVWSKAETLNAEMGEGELSRILDKSQEEVEAISLDGFFENRESPDVIKIDVEGAELHALKGAKQLLEEKRPYLLVEIHKGDRLKGFNHKPSDVVDFLKELGYVVETPSQEEEHSAYHVIAYPDDAPPPNFEK